MTVFTSEQYRGASRPIGRTAVLLCSGDLRTLPSGRCSPSPAAGSICGCIRDT